MNKRQRKKLAKKYFQYAKKQIALNILYVQLRMILEEHYRRKNNIKLQEGGIVLPCPKIDIPVIVKIDDYIIKGVDNECQLS